MQDKILNLKYQELLLKSPYFYQVFHTIHENNLSEENILEITSILCERILELENELKNKTLNLDKFRNDLENLNSLFHQEKYMKD